MPPDNAQLDLLYKAIPDLQRDAGARNLFEARVFTELVVAARLLWEQQPE
jgi:hypothetical protein